MNNLLIMELSAVAFSSGLFCAVFTLLWLAYGRACLGHWSLAYLVYGLRSIILFLGFQGLVNPGLTTGSEFLLIVLTSMLMFKGTMAFARWPTPRVLHLAWAILGLGPLLALALGAPEIMPRAAVYVGIGLIQILNGVMLFRPGFGAGGLGRHLVSLAMMAWGPHQLDNPWLRQNPVLAPWGYLLGFTLVMVMGVGFIIMFFERLKHEAEAREHDFASILNNIDCLLGYWDKDLRLRFSNHTYNDWLASPVAPGMHMAQVLGPEAFEFSRPYIRGALAGIPQSFERPLSRPDGGPPRQALIQYFPDVAQGQTRGFIAMVYDVTATKTMREQLREKNTLLTAIFQGAEDAIFVKDHQGRYQMVNKSFERQLGQTQEAIIGRTVEDLLEPGEAASAMATDERVLTQGQSVIYEQVITRPGQEPGYYQAIKGPLLDESGQITGLFGISRDITELKLIQRGLSQAKEAAEAANQVKSIFLSNMSHELRTPLSGMLSMLRLLGASNLETQHLEALDLASQAGENLMRILNDILDIAKIESGNFPMDHQPYDPRALVASVGAMFETQIRQKGLKLCLSLSPGVPARIIGDESRVRQVLFNLLGNAVKFTPSGDIGLGLTLLSQGGHLIFWVADSGIGIPQDKLAQVFEPFVQAESDLNRKYQGAGLGLAIAKRLAELMGGELSLTNRPGGGCLAEFKTPCQPAEVREEDKPGQRDFCGLKAKLLLVEDDKLNQLATCRLLEHRGQVVHCVDDGSQALEFLRQNQVDAVIMDVQMPVMDGLEALGRIRAGQAGAWAAGLPVAALTAHAMRGDRERLLAQGFDAYFAKPVDLEALLEALARLIAEKTRG